MKIFKTFLYTGQFILFIWLAFWLHEQIDCRSDVWYGFPFIFTCLFVLMTSLVIGVKRVADLWIN